MRTYIEILLLEYIFSLIFTREFSVVCTRVGEAKVLRNLRMWSQRDSNPSIWASTTECLTKGSPL